MKGKTTIKYRLLGLMNIIFSLGVLLIGILLLVFENKRGGMLMVSATMLLWIGLGYLGVILKIMKTIELEDESLIAGTFFGLNKKRYTFKCIKSVNPMEFDNVFGSYPGLLVEFRDERQIHLHEMEFKNFADLKTVITTNSETDSNLEIEMWTPFAKTFAAIGALIFLSFIIVGVVGI